jgi:hypothetical protein
VVKALPGSLGLDALARPRASVEMQRRLRTRACSYTTRVTSACAPCYSAGDPASERRVGVVRALSGPICVSSVIDAEQHEVAVPFADAVVRSVGAVPGRVDAGWVTRRLFSPRCWVLQAGACDQLDDRCPHGFGESRAESADGWWGENEFERLVVVTGEVHARHGRRARRSGGIGRVAFAGRASRDGTHTSRSGWRACWLGLDPGICGQPCPWPGATRPVS